MVFVDLFGVDVLPVKTVGPCDCACGGARSLYLCSRNLAELQHGPWNVYYVVLLSASILEPNQPF